MWTTIVGPSGLDKDLLLSEVTSEVSKLLELDPRSEFEVEKVVWQTLLSLDRLPLSVVLARMCQQLALEELSDRGLPVESVRFRLDSDYSAVVSTTLGKVVVPPFCLPMGEFPGHLGVTGRPIGTSPGRPMGTLRGRGMGTS